MTEISRPWSGITTGDSGPYSDDQWTDVWNSALGPLIASEGVFRDQLNELLASGVVTPVSVASGRAVVDGSWYESDAAVTHAISTPAGGLERFDRIVLRKDWALQTIRQTVIAGTPAAAPATIPAITQVDQTTWDLPLFIVHITDAGVMAIYADERSFVGQYNPVGGSPQRTYLEDDFLIGGNWTDSQERGYWAADIEANAGVDLLATSADIKMGGLAFTHAAAGTNEGGQLQSGNFNVTDLNAHFEAILKSPNTDANLDRFLGFASAGKDITPTEGIFFRQEGAANWFGVTRAAGVETIVDMGVGATDVIKRLSFRVLGTIGVAFFLDGVFIGASITNITSNLSLSLTLATLDDGSTPAANTYMELDWVRVQGDR